MLGSEFWSSMPERSHVSISVLFRKQEPKRFIGSLRGYVPLKKRLKKPPDLLGSVLPKCAHSLRTQDQGDGSAFQFSSVFEPFEFLDVSFCALWTFFRCLFMFLLAPKFFLHSGHSTPSWNSMCFIICWWFMKERWFSLHVPVIHIHRPGCRLCTLVLWLLR